MPAVSWGLDIPPSLLLAFHGACRQTRRLNRAGRLFGQIAQGVWLAFAGLQPPENSTGGPT
eukprot:3169517-Lingulodinium_polyedra.AAC.1